MRRYTEDQFAALDAMEDNPRTIFTGPAGTGKTVLAIEAARRAYEAGSQVLLVCYNNLLGRWLEDQVQPLSDRLVAGTLHRYMFQLARSTLETQDRSSDFWEETLPLAATERLLDEWDSIQLFDEIVIDEAQDVLRDSYLDFLDLSLKGGLAGGRLRFFGDFEKQLIYESANLTLDAFKRQRCQDVAIYSLHSNCRNTPRIATFVHLLCDLSPGYRRILRPDDEIEPRIEYYSDRQSQQRLLVSALEELHREHFSADEVVVLSPLADERCLAASIQTPPWKQRMQPLHSASPGRIRYGTVQSFKGLEAPAVVVTDVEQLDDDRSQALFYVASTRAVHRLIVLAESEARSDVQKLLSHAVGVRPLA